jgi:hypothetical protein
MATLMGAMTLVAVGLAVLFTLPSWVGILVALAISLVWIAILAAGAFFGKAAAQAFCIGALAAHWLSRIDMTYLAFPPSARDLNSLYAVLNLVGVIFADIFAGWVCVYARRFWERRDEAA